MERKHIEYICQIAPQLLGKTMLYGYWVNNLEIPDPYRKSEEAFSSVYKLIEQAANCWADKLGN
ncbi:protein tyrosine phosphatase [Escherichia coli]|nr:protein tyrosine phosphatase [Escherichia coli]KQL77078.1 protein tyrosine phosphatase [Escherichia coli]